MSELATLTWTVGLYTYNPEDETQYVVEATGGTIKLCQPDVIKKIEEIVSSVGNIVTACRGQGYVLSVEPENSNSWLIRCGIMKANITIDGVNDVTLLQDVRSKIEEVLGYEQ